MSRYVKSPAQRATEALAVAQRRVERIEAALAHQRDLVANCEGQLVDAVKRRDYAGANPDLPTEGADDE